MTVGNNPVRREQVEVNGSSLSYLTSGDPQGNTLLLLHGTFWSRVWQPILPALGEQFHCIALDFPGFGRSEGELDVDQASVPALAQTVLDAADALGLDKFSVAAHDIGGGIAQHLVANSGRVSRMVLMNAVMFDSWPVPAVERFRDPAVRQAVTAEQLQEGRREATRKAVARELTDEELDDYLSPWKSPARSRSWMAMAAAADNVHTLNLVPALREAAVPTRLVWGRDDEFQKEATRKAVARELTDEELDDYLSPWKSPARSRSWMAMAAAADNVHTLNLVPALREAAVPTRLVWGRDDEFQKIEFARRYVNEIPASDLVEVAGKHIPTEDSPEEVTDAILGHLHTSVASGS
ncbi:alpha/beta fold hydrolase [Arthrobacter sp. H14]|uniref:alpha/beta fold hydrolase n=1 Tax=Arthrobacter sp. H14 TaxID=1312959 RepID=UPI0004B5F13B|nr:alpha/beta fold hydrolase [Arthrobacter sp. H14]